MTTLHDFRVNTIDGQPKSLKDYAGHPVLVVNVASRCGLTPQYSALEELYERFKPLGLEVLAFPCNDFGAQEPGTEAEIKTFCETKYNVTFPLFAKLHVKGPEQAPLYGFLTSQQTAPDAAGEVAWNFAKFLVDKEGQVIARFTPQTAPDAPEVLGAIQAAL
ncbi:MAG: glutathione peroxidase [Polyangiales bacterium]